MIRPVALSEAHMECRSLAESVPVLTELLAFEQVAHEPGMVLLRHPNTEWLLGVHEAGPGAPVKQMHNHFGVRVESNGDVDAAHQYLLAHQGEYRLSSVGAPAFSHGSYSLYFLEPGTNGWEIECYEYVLRKEAGGQRLGGVRSRHWEAALPTERFPGRGYVPQAFTHGTLACGDIEASARFYQEVLGLEAHRAYPKIVYVKHPARKHYIVCAERAEWNTLSPNFRFTLTVESGDDAAAAHAWLGKEGAAVGVRELRPIEAKGGAASFLLADLDGNWWEIASAAP